ncbi:dual specificity phosphatase [Catovirus CTV1]|uniref:protein-serine/threonine phosphatase n=1 Tax=Catovirus CTV1 TaxID=1977631 RepID=A0A1V0SAP0_9VIRU|nr:dual specificity phosphatase [Catovirus CTV1]
MTSILSYISATYRILTDKICEYWDNKDNNTDERIFGNSSMYNQYVTFFCSPNHIIDNIYLGSAFNAANFSQLSELGIEVIVNVTKEISMHFPKNYIYKKFELYDNKDENIEKYLLETFEFIKQHKDKKIFIHCKMGASRSVSVLLYYLMKEYNMNLDNALDYIKDRRMIINPNSKFIETLRKYDKKIEK